IFTYYVLAKKRHVFMKIWNDIIQEYKRGTNLTRVIYSNIAVFISLHILRLLSWLFVSNSSSTVLNFIIANIQTYLNPYILITKPWTVFTYMFTHISFIHLLTNMLMLY